MELSFIMFLSNRRKALQSLNMSENGDLDKTWPTYDQRSLCSEGLEQNFWNKLNNPEKLDRTRKLLYLFLRKVSCFFQNLSPGRRIRH